VTGKVIPLHQRRLAHPDVTLTFQQAHAIAALLRDLRQYADTPDMVNRAIQLLTSPTNGGAA
jgi:hypothetical protein